MFTLVSDAARVECPTPQHVYDYVKYTLQFTATDICAIADTGVHKGWTLQGLPPTRVESERVCVCLSGRVVQPDKLAASWNDFAQTHEVDFVGHVWSNTALPSGLTYVMTDTRQDNRALLGGWQYPKDIPNKLIVAYDARDGFDDVARINSQLYGIAATFAMGMLYAACSGITYRWVVRARFDYVQHNFEPSLCKADLHIPEYGMLGDMFPPPFLSDVFYFGKPKAMRHICLAFDNWRNDIMEQVQPRESEPILQRLIRYNALWPSSVDKRLLIINQAGTRWSLMPSIGHIRWHIYTPERLLPILCKRHNLRLEKDLVAVRLT
jgi:hypothetical protein